MSDDHADLDAFPDRVAHRAEELVDYGLPFELALGAAVDQAAQTGDWDLDKLAKNSDLTPDQLHTLAVEANQYIETAARLFIAEFGGPTHILAEQQMRYRIGTRYIVADVAPARRAPYESTVEGECGVLLITVEAGGPSGEPAGNRSVRTERFDSLDALADAKYRENDSLDFDGRSQWRSLLIDAGVDEDTLDSPGATLPPGHPDSDDHHQHQMQSLEPPEQRGREHGDRR